MIIVAAPPPVLVGRLPIETAEPDLVRRGSGRVVFWAPSDASIIVYYSILYYSILYYNMLCYYAIAYNTMLYYTIIPQTSDLWSKGQASSGKSGKLASARRSRQLPATYSIVE